MTGATLLVELLTEELPPKALPKLGLAFSNAIVAGLRARGLAAAEGDFRWFATPRRLAAREVGEGRRERGRHTRFPLNLMFVYTH